MQERGDASNRDMNGRVLTIPVGVQKHGTGASGMEQQQQQDELQRRGRIGDTTGRATIAATLAITLPNSIAHCSSAVLSGCRLLLLSLLFFSPLAAMSSAIKLLVKKSVRAHAQAMRPEDTNRAELS